MSESRINNTKRNLLFSYIETIVTLLFQFFSRTIIINVLGDSYLGLSSLFNSILQVLCMAELGFSSAIIFNMYKPLADGNTDKVCRLLEYYKRVYRIVGIIVTTIGLIILPFLPYLIKSGTPDDINIYILYLLFLCNTGISYFLFAYKSALLNALQRLDLTKIAYTVATVLQYGFQILSLVIFKNFYLYIIILIIGTAAKNIFTAWIAKKKYPQYVCRGNIDTKTKKDISKRVKGILIGNISSVTYTTLDSILLSSFIGLSAVTIYNNYIVVVTSLLNFFSMIRNAMQASVGNSVAKESKEKNYRDMLLWQFLFSVIATWATTCLYSLYQPFMTLWMGDSRLLPMIDVGMICAWLFICVIQHPFFLYLSGNGLWWEMRWPYILSTITNLIMNIVLGKIFGTAGILFSTVFASTIFGLIWQGSIIFKVYFHKSAKQFYIRQFYYTSICLLACFAAYFINNLFTLEGIIGLGTKLIVCTIISISIMYVAYFKTAIFPDAKELISQVITNRVRSKY